ncbi:hypothetical protein AXF42_Ash004108 [Apostasia shenzhenica]|uniref:Uncharacterized protein n=1 Tax=Apostasia shenzhenica TaxID=1088818 RepID=A0A2I0A200_9ASPA|nr:hypothetical protein AXF42_Ash004108 [Apostasia shenzhenica]
MDSQTQNSFKESNSLLMRCSCLFSFIFLTILLSSFVILILAILKPKKPHFHLHSIHLGHINLSTSSGKDIFFPPSIASVIFLTENSNKFGIRYSSSDLGVIYEDNPVGIVAVPAFYQPPYGRNVTVIMHVLLQRINITKFLNTKANSNGSSSNGSEVEGRWRSGGSKQGGCECDEVEPSEGAEPQRTGVEAVELRGRSSDCRRAASATAGSARAAGAGAQQALGRAATVHRSGTSAVIAGDWGAAWRRRAGRRASGRRHDGSMDPSGGLSGWRRSVAASPPASGEARASAARRDGKKVAKQRKQENSEMNFRDVGIPGNTKEREFRETVARKRGEPANGGSGRRLVQSNQESTRRFKKRRGRGKKKETKKKGALSWGPDTMKNCSLCPCVLSFGELFSDICRQGWCSSTQVPWFSGGKVTDELRAPFVCHRRDLPFVLEGEVDCDRRYLVPSCPRLRRLIWDRRGRWPVRRHVFGQDAAQEPRVNNNHHLIHDEA